jgi:hypothetical protein
MDPIVPEPGLFTITAPCPVCSKQFELTQPMADHLGTHDVDELEAAGLKVIIAENYTGCTERGCDCRLPPWEGCDCPAIQVPAEGTIPASEEAHCVVSARYNNGDGDTPICHGCEHFVASHVARER